MICFFASREPKFMLILRDELFLAFNYEHYRTQLKYFYMNAKFEYGTVVVFYCTQWPTYMNGQNMGIFYRILVVFAICRFCTTETLVYEQRMFLVRLKKNRREKQ